MATENLKLTSVRLDPETLTKIEEFCKKRTYWKKNTVINRILMTVMRDFDDGEIYDMVRRNHFLSQHVEKKYEIV